MEPGPSRSTAIAFLAADTAAWVVYAFVQSLPYILFPVFQQEFSLNYAEVALMVTAFGVAYAAMEVPSGLVADRIGRRQVLVFGLLLSSVGNILTYLANSYYQILLLRIVSGLGLGMLFASSMALLTEFFPNEQRGKAIGVLGAGISGGFLAAPVAVGTLLTKLGWRSMFLSIGVLTIPLAVVMWMVVREPATYSREDLALRGAYSRLTESLSRPILVLAAINLTTAIAITGLNSFVPTYLVRVASLSVTDASLLYSVFPVGGLVSTFLWGVATDRLDRWQIMLWGVIASVGSLILQVLTVSPSALLVVLVARGLVSNASGIALYAVFAEFSDSRTRATSFAFLDLLGNVGTSLSPLLAGVIADSLGLTYVFLLIPSIMGGITLLPMWMVRRYITELPKPTGGSPVAGVRTNTS